ncbi:acyltransferase family protein [Hymenobacter lucidus]|uniref:Acyltransferase n=1 Tax=Hymenobacter lucidus TaxID=2880930 RepID=A0ABS8AWP9_9BACT|nr:acyltransferase [Hymenobacter lucidus]MCB2410222.1 acyltransferase [Hymenobacter lucidus]
MKQYYKSLTGIRAIAAFMIFFHHYNPGESIFDSNTLYDIFNELHVGVTVFFTLSGFLIANRYLGKTEFTVPYFLRYFTNRFARIYPLYFLLTSIIFGKYYLSDPSSKVVTEYLMNITFLKGFSWFYFGTGIQQAWSLTVEECFYLFAFFFFLALQGSKIRKILVWLSAIILLPATGYLLIELFAHLGMPFFEDDKLVLSYSFFGRFIEFFVGIGLALLIRRANFTFRYFTHVGTLLFALGIYFLIRIEYIYGVEFGIKHPLGVAINNIYLPFTIATVFLGLLQEKTVLSRVLSTNLFSVLGKSSYAFYLIHMGFYHALILPYFDESSTLGYFGSFATLVAMSIALFYCFEEPMNKGIRALFARISKSPAPPASTVAELHPTPAA